MFFIIKLGAEFHVGSTKPRMNVYLSSKRRPVNYPSVDFLICCRRLDIYNAVTEDHKRRA